MSENHGYHPEDEPNGQQNPDNSQQKMAGEGWQSYQAQPQQGPSANQNGSQQTPPQQPSDNSSQNQPYSFRMEDYEQISSSGTAARPKGGNTGLKIFAVVISVLLVVALAALGGLLLYTYQNNQQLETTMKSEAKRS